MVVVVGELLDDGARTAQAGSRPDEHVPGAGRDEGVDERLGELTIDLPHPIDPDLLAVGARVGDVGVQAVLVGGVPEAAVLGAEAPTLGQREVVGGPAR